MKICIVSDYLPGLHGNWSGAELVAWKTGQLLTGRGHKISHIALSAPLSKTQDNVYYVKTPFTKLSFLAKNFFIDFPSFLKIFKILRTIKPDVVHIQAKFLFFPSAISAFLLKIPYFFTVLDYYILCPRNTLLCKNGELCCSYHGSRCSSCVIQSDKKTIKLFNLLFPLPLKQLLFIIRKKSVDAFMQKAAKLITFSQASKKRLLAYGYDENHIKVLYHYAFDEIKPFIQGKRDIKNNKVLFVGTITYHKGLHIIIEAMRVVVKEIPGAKLLIAGQGKGKYLDLILGLVDKFNLRNHIEFLGHKNNREILELMKKVDIVVVPEQWYSEFGPIILIESKLSHKPVVASKIGSIPEFVRDGLDGVLVTFNDANAFAKGIIGLLENSDSMSCMADGISEDIKKISDSNDTFGALEKAYAACL